MFMSAAPNAAAPPDLPDPQPDRPAAGTPGLSRTGRLRCVLRKLIDYGKELASALRRQQHISPANLIILTLDFGTADIGLILAYITRALLRAAALEARLVSRGDRRDDAPARVRDSSARRPRPGQPPAEQRDKDADPRVVGMPTPEKIAALIRRRPAGSVLAEICFDLGIGTRHPLWQELWSVIDANGGNAHGLLIAMCRRERKVIAARRTGAGAPALLLPALAPPALAPPAWPAPCAPLAAASGAGPP
jgi:hypothetical protein